MSLIKSLSPALPAWFLWVSFSLFPNVDKLTMNLDCPSRDLDCLPIKVTWSDTNWCPLPSCSMLNLKTITLHLSVFFFLTRACSPRPCVDYQSPLHTATATTSLLFFCLIHMAVTPSIGSPAIDKFIFSQAPFLHSAINLTPPHLSILQYSLASPPLLRPPSPHQSPLWQVSSLPLSLSAIFPLSIERRSYFIACAVHEDTTLRPVTLKSGSDLNLAVWWSLEIHITERHI